MANTPNLGLHQWAPDDSFKRTDFNEDFSKIDAGVQAAKIASPCVAGRFTGDGTAGRVVTLGFNPSAVILVFTDGSANNRERCHLFFATGQCMDYGSYCSVNATALTNMQFTPTGFIVKEAHYGNVSGVATAYLAFR